MKKLISFICIVTLLVSSFSFTLVYAADNAVSYDFEGYVGDAGWTLEALKKYGGSWGEYYLESGVVGPTDVQTDRGTSVDLIHKGQDDTASKYRYCTIRIKPLAEITTSAELRFSMQVGDLNRNRSAIFYGGKQITTFTIGASSISILGNTLTMKPAIGKWYDVTMKFNMQTGYYVCTVGCGSTTETFEGVNADLAASGKLTQVGLGYWGDRKSGTPRENHTYMDDMYFAETSPFCKILISQNNFDSFAASSDGTTIPSGFTAEGVMANTAGFHSENGALKINTSASGTLSLNKAFGLNAKLGAVAYGVIRAQSDVNFADKNAARSFCIGTKEIVSFGTDSNVVIGNASGVYDTATDYTVVIKCSTKPDAQGKLYASAYVVDGSAKLAEGSVEIAASDITSVSLKIVSSGEAGVMYADNFGIYGDNGFFIVNSSPSNGSKDIMPSDVVIEFSNPISAVTGVTLNESAVDYEITNANTIKVKSAAIMNFGTEYTLSLNGIKDVFGESKSFSLKFSTIVASTLSSITLVEKTAGSDAMVEAVVTGAAYDGNTYSYSLILAKFDSSKGSLIDVKKTDFTLSSTMTDYSVTIDKSDLSYYEAYVWKSIGTMEVVGTKAVLGTEPLADAVCDKNGFTEDMDTGVVYGKNIGISSTKGTAIIMLKPGKTKTDLEASSALTDVIDYIRQFDSKPSDIFAYTPASGGGKYSMLKDGVFTADVFDYVDPVYVNMVYTKINEPGADFVDCVKNYNDVLTVDTTELSAFSPSQTGRINTLVLAEREALSSGFETVAAFQKAYNYAMARTLIENANSSLSVVEAAIEKYGVDLGVRSFAAYPTYATLDETATDEIYSDISKLSALTTVGAIDKAFSEATVLRAISNADNQVDVGNIITNNNSKVLGFDLTDYNALKVKSSVHSALVGKYFSSIANLKENFNNAVLQRKSVENTGGSKSPTGSAPSRDVVSLPSVFVPDDTQSSANTVFNDLTAHEWAREAIEHLASKAIVGGRSEGIFAPADNITREEFTKIVVNAFAEVDMTANCSFDDVAATDWFYPYIATAYKLGLVNGKDSRSFGAGDNISRQDMAVILYRAAVRRGYALSNGSLTFADSDSIATYAKESVASLALNGVINGKGDNNFEPVSFATRAESAKMIFELMNKGGEF